MNIRILGSLLMTAGAIAACTSRPPQLGKESLDKVIGAMTPEEKVHLLIGNGMEGFPA